MAITTQKTHSFPSNAVSDNEKASMEYGKRVAQAVEHEWFRKDAGTTKYLHSKPVSYTHLTLPTNREV